MKKSERQRVSEAKKNVLDMLTDYGADVKYIILRYNKREDEIQVIHKNLDKEWSNTWILKAGRKYRKNLFTETAFIPITEIRKEFGKIALYDFARVQKLHLNILKEINDD